jgi:hypothetical protein
MGSFEMRQKYGGSILFLARNLAMAATPDFQPKTQDILRDAAGRWVSRPITWSEWRMLVSAAGERLIRGTHVAGM